MYEVFKTIPAYIDVGYKIQNDRYTFSSEGLIKLIENAYMAGVFKGISEEKKIKDVDNWSISEEGMGRW